MTELVPKPQSRIAIIDQADNASNYFIRFLTNITDVLNGTFDIVAAGVSQVALGTGIKISSGTGSPEGVVAGSPGDLYTNTVGGANTTLYVKESGSATKTGWVGK